MKITRSISSVVLLALTIATAHADTWKTLTGSMPDMPTLPPIGFQWPGASDLLNGTMDVVAGFSTDLASATPYLEEAGFRIETLNVQMLPPSAKLRLMSTIDATADPVAAAVPDSASVLVKTMVASALTAKKVQSLMGLELVIMEVDVSTAPTIKLSYLRSVDDAQSTFQLIDLNRECRDNL